MCSRPLFSLYFGDGVWVGSSEQLLLLLGYVTPPFAFWFAQNIFCPSNTPIFTTPAWRMAWPPASSFLLIPFLGHLGHVDILAS
jgi:hypothetical protein